MRTFCSLLVFFLAPAGFGKILRNSQNIRTYYTLNHRIRCINLYTGCPKSSFLYFKSLYFSMIGLGKQIITTKSCVFQYNSLFSYLLCHLLTRIFDLCTSAPKVRARVYVPATYFLYFIARIARTPSLLFCEYHER